MPRLMSVTLTVDAVRERRKRVTRRAGWTFLEPGTRLTLCEKVMGRRKGDPLVRICDVRVVSVRREPLNAITDDDVALEGFNASDLIAYLDADSRIRHRDGFLLLSGDLAAAFVRFFVSEMGGAVDQTVTRIEWEYL